MILPSVLQNAVPSCIARLVIAIAGWLCTVAPIAAAEDINLRWSVGWDGVVKLGRWSVATAEFTLPQSDECLLECHAPDGEGHVAVYAGPTVKLEAGSHRLQTPFQIGRIGSSVLLRLKRQAGGHSHVTLPPTISGGLDLRPLSDRLIVSVGRVRSITALANTPLRTPVRIIERPTGGDLPDEAAAYDGVDWLVISGAQTLPEPQSDAIREWVRDGGRLILALPKTSEAFRSSPLSEWLPFTLGEEPVAVRDLGSLEAFAGITLRIPTSGRVLAAAIDAPDGIPLASIRSDELITRIPFGFGEVVVVALDLTQPPLANWGGINDFVRKLLRLEPAASDDRAAANVRGQLTSNGISDLASQLVANMDHFPAVRRASPWWSMVWLLACLLVIGPADYLFVHRVLKRPHLTWLTLPIFVLAFAGVAASMGRDWNSSAARLNQLDIVDVDVATQAVRAKSYATYYSPVTQRVELAATPSATDASQKLACGGINWCFIPEATTGGMYRPAGAEWGKTEYQIDPFAGQVAALPVLQWSTRTVASQWTEVLPAAAEADLHSTGLGRLVGTVTHRLPGPIADWIVAYGNRAYWLPVARNELTTAPWVPGRTLSLEDPLMTQGDLKGLLTRVVATEEKGKTANDTRIRLEEGRYDPSQRDPFRLWQMITFHTAAGGTGYTRLSPDGLLDDDFTRQLELGRAVVFGRLNARPWLETRVNGTALETDREDVFVRLVLPVRRSGEFVRELPKFDK